MAPFFVFSNLHSKLSWFTFEGSVRLWWGRNCADWQNRGQLLPFRLSLQSELWFTTGSVFERRHFLTWQAAVIERKKVTMHSVSYLFIVILDIYQKLRKLVNLQLTPLQTSERQPSQNQDFLSSEPQQSGGKTTIDFRMLLRSSVYQHATLL